METPLNALRGRLLERADEGGVAIRLGAPGCRLSIDAVGGHGSPSRDPSINRVSRWAFDKPLGRSAASRRQPGWPRPMRIHQRTLPPYWATLQSRPEKSPTVSDEGPRRCGNTMLSLKRSKGGPSHDRRRVHGSRRWFERSSMRTGCASPKRRSWLSCQTPAKLSPASEGWKLRSA